MTSRVEWQTLSPVLPAGLYGPARRQLTPGAAGRSSRRHVALTFDDGPDPTSTPRFLELLARHECRATFFLIGQHAQAHPDLVRAIANAGHEVGIHRWTHRCTATTAARQLVDDVRRTRELLTDLTATDVVWYRPPYGVATLSSRLAARQVGLRPVLWTAWGRDWNRRATAETIVRTVRRTLWPGGTVLLHDVDTYGAAGCWRQTLVAAELLLQDWKEQGLPVGRLDQHGLSSPSCARVAVGGPYREHP